MLFAFKAFRMRAIDVHVGTKSLDAHRIIWFKKKKKGLRNIFGVKTGRQNKKTTMMSQIKHT